MKRIDRLLLVLSSVLPFGSAQADNNIYGTPITPPANGAIFVSQGSATGVSAGLSPLSGAPLLALGGRWTVLGTPFTISGCSATFQSGGSIAGAFLSGTSGTCTVTVTLNGASGASAPNGWACSVNDLTTPADVLHQTASTTGTATFSGTTVTGDAVNFLCQPY